MTDNELNALVAKHVMDAYNAQAFSGEWMQVEPGLYQLPDYANDIAAAFQVVEHFQSRGFGWRIQLEPDCRTWRVCNHDDGLFLAGWKDRHGYISETATTAPRAICLAALMAVGVEVEG